MSTQQPGNISYKQSGVCQICGMFNTECIEFERPWGKLWTFSILVCQSCMSKAFRRLVKGR